MKNPVNLVLLPGLDGTGSLFAGLLLHLGPDIRPTVIAYPADSALGYAALTEYVRSRLPAEPYVLLGESFSGPIAIALAASEPCVHGLILCCTFARTPWPLPSVAAREEEVWPVDFPGIRQPLARHQAVMRGAQGEYGYLDATEF